MDATVSFKRLILRAVLRHVSSMVIRLISVPDHMDLPEFHRTILAIGPMPRYVLPIDTSPLRH